MLTALYCRGFVLPALSSQPCAHGLGSWSYSPDLILRVIFFQSYSSGIISWPCIWHRVDLDLMLRLALHGLTCSDIAGCGLAQVDRFSWIARLFCRRLGTYADCDRARTLGFRGLLLWL